MLLNINSVMMNPKLYLPELQTCIDSFLLDTFPPVPNRDI